jgi:hypothetical protein
MSEGLKGLRKFFGGKSENVRSGETPQEAFVANAAETAASRLNAVDIGTSSRKALTRAACFTLLGLSLTGLVPQSAAAQHRRDMPGFKDRVRIQQGPSSVPTQRGPQEVYTHDKYVVIDGVRVLQRQPEHGHDTFIVQPAQPRVILPSPGGGSRMENATSQALQEARRLETIRLLGVSHAETDITANKHANPRPPQHLNKTDETNAYLKGYWDTFRRLQSPPQTAPAPSQSLTRPPATGHSEKAPLSVNPTIPPPETARPQQKAPAQPRPVQNPPQPQGQQGGESDTFKIIKQ